MNFRKWKRFFLPDLSDWFKSYVKRFQSEDPVIQKNIDLKRDHSLRVMQEIRFLADHLHLDAERIAFAEALGLLHDIGRFEQYSKYKTFVDLLSENHGTLGVAVLKHENILNGIDADIQDLICYAIGNHNAKELPFHPEPEAIFYTQLLRDADKLDIFHVVTAYYENPDPEYNDAILLNLPDLKECSESAIEELLQGKMVSSEHVQCQNDFKLLQLGWIFDVNFSKTLTLIRERNIVDKIRNVLPDTKKIDQVVIKLNQTIAQGTGIQNKP